MLEHVKSAARTAALTPSVGAETATFVGFGGAYAIVDDAQGVRQRWRWSGLVLPVIGDAVQVERRDGQHLVVGVAMPRPTQGTVTAVSSTALKVDAWGSQFDVAFNRSAYASPAVGDIVAIMWGPEGGIALGKSSFTPVHEAPEAATQPGQTFRPAPFRAQVLGNWNRGAWEPGYVAVSDNRVAGFDYGPQLGDTIPDSAVIVAARIYLPATQVRFARPAEAQAFDGPPPASGGVGPLAPLSARTGWIDLPLGVAEQLKTGRRGIKLHRTSISSEGTWDIYDAADPLCGALDLTWR